METAVSRGWRTSSYSGNGGQCVEVAGNGRRVLVRDTTDQAGPVLQVTPHTWRHLLDRVKSNASFSIRTPV